jgi:HK97 family phage portal protein
MSLLKRLGNTLPVTTGTPVIMNGNTAIRPFGFNDGVTIYPYNNDRTYIEKGYNKNAWVFAIVSKLAKKFSQVPWYHYKIKRAERKTYFEEYIPLTKAGLNSKSIIEARKMLKKSVDQQIVDSPLSRFLNKPNRNQSGAQYREELYGYKLLTGEGNGYLSKIDNNGPPVERFIIPKNNIALVKGPGILSDIAGYKMLLGGNTIEVAKELILMWKFPNYNFDPLTLAHMRGQSPLDAGLLVLQSSNEATERMVAMNKNQGVAGLVARKDAVGYPTPTQASFMREQFNSIVNDKDLAGSIAYMTGDLSYMQFGLDAGQLKLMEQADIQFKQLCNIYDIPWQLFGNADSYENRKQYKRDLIYDNIAVACYSYRDEENAKLIPQFNLDRESDVIDCDLFALPELSEDLKTQIDGFKSAWWMTPNEIREQTGFDRIIDTNMDKVYAPSSVVPVDQMNAEIGAGLDAQINLLNQ